MRHFIKIFFRYFILIALAFLFECMFNKIVAVVFYNLFENIIFAIILICPLCFFKSGKLKVLYFIVTFSFFLCCIYFETVYYYLFKTYFSSSAIFVTLDSNIKEASEFISFYSDYPILIFTILFLIIGIILLIKTKKSLLNNIICNRKDNFKIFGLILGLLLFLKLSILIIFNLPYLIIKSSIEYYAESQKLGNYQQNKNGSFNNIIRKSKDNENEVYVIIIGESTSRSHLGLYGYYRETTPELDKIKGQLLIYNNVISPHAYSVGSLTKILTLGNYEKPKKITDGSIIQLANSVGFETYWISNQRPIGPYESLITKISLSAKKHKFLTTTLAGNSKVLDGEILSEFHKVVNNKVRKKVVFLHLMGTHHHYENRYPESFNKFNDEPKTRFKSQENFTKINHYDNAVLYNDFLIYKVIKTVDSLKTKSFVLYFSDHGEEMFDALNMAGHNEDIYSKKMFEVPFLLWRSQKYEQEKKLVFIENRKYMIDDLFFSVSDLLSIEGDQVDSTRSIFNENFKERKRIIKDTIDFDTYFK